MEQQDDGPVHHLDRTIASTHDLPNIAAARLLALASCLPFIKGNIMSEEEIQSIEQRIHDQRPREIDETAWRKFIWNVYQNISRGDFNPLVGTKPYKWDFHFTHPSVFECAEAAGWTQQPLNVLFGKHIARGNGDAHNIIHARLAKMLAEFTDQPPPDDIDALSELLVDLAELPNESVEDRCKRLAAEFTHLRQAPGFRRYIFSPSDPEGIRVIRGIFDDSDNDDDDCASHQPPREVYINLEHDLFQTWTDQELRDVDGDIEGSARDQVSIYHRNLLKYDRRLRDASTQVKDGEHCHPNQSSAQQQPGNAEVLNRRLTTSAALLDQEATPASRPGDIVDNVAFFSEENRFKIKQRMQRRQRESAARFSAASPDPSVSEENRFNIQQRLQRAQRDYAARFSAASPDPSNSEENRFNIQQRLQRAQREFAARFSAASPDSSF
jgi:hypothetical protein